MNWLKRLIESPRLLFWLGMLVFTYSWLASLLLQLWVIPTLFSQPGAAEGLVVLDSMGFHSIAKDKAAEIARLGWSAWELKPQKQSPAGIASFFYTLLGPTPASILPFNAAVHAISACVVMTVLRSFFAAMPAILGALVFALNPASFEWVAQIHRDGMFILGNLLLIVGVLRFIPKDKFDIGHMKIWFGLCWVMFPVAGTFLIWVARPYWVQVAFITIVLVAVTVMLASLFRRVNAGHRMVWFAGMVMLVGLF